MSETVTDETLLREAEDALHSISLRLIGVSVRLSEPYTNAPEHSAWSLIIGPQARRAHDLAAAIRKHLGLPYRHPTRALGTPPLEVEDVIAEAVAAERERCAHLGEQFAAGVSDVGLASAFRRFAAMLRKGGQP
jgi:hypothetical protein